jgi:hypothetical protein
MALATDSSGFSYRTMETVYLFMVSSIEFRVQEVRILRQSIFVCRYLPTDKNLSLCPLCLSGENPISLRLTVAYFPI